jgi:hypothetical protein
VSRKKGDPRLARLRTLIGRAIQQCGERAAEVRQAHGWLLQLAQRLEPAAAETDPPPSGAQVRARVEAYLTELTDAVADGRVSPRLQAAVEHVVVVLRRLGSGLYHCYDVPGLPRTDNDLEQFYRRVKSGQRRITGHKRSDAFVVRVGGFAVYATAAGSDPEPKVLAQLATVSAAAWQQERATLRANQARQTKMRRFRLQRTAYLADLEARWVQLTGPP